MKIVAIVMHFLFFFIFSEKNSSLFSINEHLFQLLIEKKTKKKKKK